MSQNDPSLEAPNATQARLARPSGTMAHSSRPLNVGVIGVGGIGREHIKVLGQTPGCRVVAVASRRPARTQECQTAFGIPSAYSSLGEMLRSDPTVDAVVLAVHEALHYPLTLEALFAGKHVLCEKPPAEYLGQLQAMVEAAALNGQILQFGFQFRYMTAEVEAVIGQGALGHIYHAEADWLRRDGVPRWWTEQPVHGAFADLGAHLLERIGCLLDCPRILSVLGRTSRHFTTSGQAPEDTGVACYYLDGDRTLVVKAAWDSRLPTKETMAIRLWGTHGYLELPLLTGHGAGPVIVQRPDGDITLGALPTVDACRARLAAHWVACCRGVESAVGSPADLWTQAALDAFYAAAQS